MWIKPTREWDLFKDQDANDGDEQRQKYTAQFYRGLLDGPRRR